jgi:hypothetical protein
LEALDVLKSKTVDGRMVVENPNRKLAKLEFCQKNQPSELATMRYNELMGNLEGDIICPKKRDSKIIPLITLRSFIT